METAEENYSTTASPGQQNITKAQENDLKSNLTKIREPFKDKNEQTPQRNTGKLKTKQQKIKRTGRGKRKLMNPLEIQVNTIKQMQEMHKTVQDLKMEIEAIKKTQSFFHRMVVAPLSKIK